MSDSASLRGETGPAGMEIMRGEQPKEEAAKSLPVAQPAFVLPEFPAIDLQGLMDLTRQILPAETYTHLQNAGKETLLALYSIWKGIDRAVSGNSGEKVRKHIDIE